MWFRIPMWVTPMCVRPIADVKPILYLCSILKYNSKKVSNMKLTASDWRKIIEAAKAVLTIIAGLIGGSLTASCAHAIDLYSYIG